uniref:Uncharacterized protein n=1 Tax=Norrisiella sphaerica TaxID=552664 RepID=A0A7S2VU68_9EUKA
MAMISSSFTFFFSSRYRSMSALFTLGTFYPKASEVGVINFGFVKMTPYFQGVVLYLFFSKTLESFDLGDFDSNLESLVSSAISDLKLFTRCSIDWSRRTTSLSRFIFCGSFTTAPGVVYSLWKCAGGVLGGGFGVREKVTRLWLSCATQVELRPSFR